ncbi:MAG: putative sugar O-methyltransferase [Desulfovibrionaceae bacterium]|nr:putative sugar O-methyltransferase [Desulfovibrionaceae bacterium]
MENNVASLIEEKQNISLKDDFELLDVMLSDSKRQSSLYWPGPYWSQKAKNAACEIKRYGIADFRGSTNLIGLSYADNLFIDIRKTYMHCRGFWRFVRRLSETFPINRLFEAQVRWTEAWANQSILYTQELLKLHDRAKALLKKYTMPYSLLGNCLKKAELDGHEFSIHYLNLLEQHDNVASRIRFNDAHAVFEIGGGFGVNIHLLLENYKNIKKILYLDIPPNLYVATQYLKSFYGARVFDYRALRDLDSIKFSEDDNIEIFCIAPWQIENFMSPIDIFINSNSFVEMPKNIVQNYVDKFNGFPESKDAAIAMTTYDGFGDATLHPNELPKFFKDREFDCFEADRLLESAKQNFFFVSSGKLSCGPVE